MVRVVAHGEVDAKLHGAPHDRQVVGVGCPRLFAHKGGISRAVAYCPLDAACDDQPGTALPHHQQLFFREKASMLHSVNARFDRPCRRIAAVGLYADIPSGGARLIDSGLDLFAAAAGNCFFGGKCRTRTGHKYPYKVDTGLQLFTDRFTDLDMPAGLPSHKPQTAAALEKPRPCDQKSRAGNDPLLNPAPYKEVDISTLARVTQRRHPGKQRKTRVFHRKKHLICKRLHHRSRLAAHTKAEMVVGVDKAGNHVKTGKVYLFFRGPSYLFRYFSYFPIYQP